MMPEKLRAFWVISPAWLSLTFEDQAVILVSQGKKRTDRQDIRFENLEDKRKDIQKHIRHFIKQNKHALVGLRLKPESCFERHLEFPKDAKDKLTDIIQLDLERSTPFKIDQIYHDFYIEQEQPQTIHVRHIIAKKTRLDPQIELARTLSPALDFIDVWADELPPGHNRMDLPINLLEAQTDQSASRPKSSLNALLFCVLVLAASLSIFQAFSRQSEALSELNFELSKARKVNEKFKKTLEHSNSVQSQIMGLERMKINSVSTLDTWTELTKLMPDQAWVQEFRIIWGGQAQISGFASSAEGLIEILETSDLFENVKFISPVSQDLQEKKERFSIQFSISKPLKDQVIPASQKPHAEGGQP